MFAKNYIVIAFIFLNQFISYSQKDDLEIINEFLICNDITGEYLIKLNNTPLRNVTALPELIFYTKHSLFGRSQVTLIQEINNKFYLRYKDSNKKINRFKLSGFDLEILLDDVELIKELVTTAIRTSKHIQGIPGSDGTDYYFGVNDNEFIVGKTWSPNQDRMYRLKEISLSITNLVINHSNKTKLQFDNKLREQIKNLILEFKN